MQPPTTPATRVVQVVRLLEANKARLAFLAPVIVAALVTAGNWIATGTFDATEIRTAAAGVVLGAAAALGAYHAPAGPAEITDTPPRT